MTAISCDCCLSTSINKLVQHNGYQHYVCNDCHYEFFVNTEVEIEASIYENDEGYNDDLTLSENYETLILWNHKKALRYIKSHYPAGSKVLDVGCFNGFFVKKLLTLGYDAYGVDFNEQAIQFGIDHFGLDSRISTKKIADIEEDSDKFDVITLFEVLEHLDSPVSDFLKKIEKLLKPGGSLVISVPNSAMMWRPKLDFPPHHISRFSRQSLLKLASRLEGTNNTEIYQQMSLFDLIRNFAGERFFRSNDADSLRGGEFKHRKASLHIRRVLNKIKNVAVILFWPIDFLFYIFGFRYIGQVMFIKK